MAFHESAIVASIAHVGLRKTFESFINVNDARILAMRSSDGWDVVRERSLIFDVLLKYWFGSLTTELFKGGAPPFEYAFTAVGGYGRREINPNSDIDVDLIVDDKKLNENPLVQRVTEAARYTLEEEIGFTFAPMVHNLDDLQGLAEKHLNTFLDMRYLCGSQELTDRIRERLRAQYDPLELFLHNVAFLQEAQKKYPQSFDDVEQFNIKSGVGGLRNVHAMNWMQACATFESSERGYRELQKYESLWESIGVMLQTRSWLNLHKERKRQVEALAQKQPLPKKTAQDHIEADTFRYEDFQALKEAFGTSALERLGFARREIYNYTQAKMHEHPAKGLELGAGIVYGPQGLFLRLGESTIREKNESMFALVLKSQRSGIPIAPTENLATFHDAHLWAQPCATFGRLFVEKGSLFDTLTLLAGKHILDRVIPGYTHLRASLHDSDHRARNLTRAGFALQKVKTLEDLTTDGAEYPDLRKRAQSLSPEQLAGLRLGLVVKRIPYVDASMPGVVPQSVETYLEDFCEPRGFSEDSQTFAQFLIRHHNLLRRTAREHLPDATTVEQFLDLCPDLPHLNALLLFTYADHGSFDRGDTRHFWKSIDELVRKAHAKIEDKRPLSYNPLEFDESERALAEDLGPDFMSGRYASGLSSWVSHLRKAQETGAPVIKPHYHGDSQLLGVACVDYPGLLSVITGSLLESGVALRQAQAYSLSQHRLALDFFDVVPSKTPLPEVAGKLAEAITHATLITTSPHSLLGPLSRKVALDYRPHSGQYRLFFESDRDAPGILYALTRVLQERLSANIHGMSAYAFKGKNVEDYLFFTTPLSEEDVRRNVQEHIGALGK